MFLESKKQVKDYIKDTIEASLFFKLEKQSMINFNFKKDDYYNKNNEYYEMRYFYVERIDEEKKIILFI